MDNVDLDRRASVDLTLELEHQLNDAEDEEHPNVEPLSQRVSSTSLDPDVLATIVIQQRASLAELTHERDELAAALSKAHIIQSELQSRAIDLQDGLDAERERFAQLMVELAEAKEKEVSDAESISMLRAKVEESRRGLMRLQSERDSRRASQFQPLQLDLGSAASSTSGTGRTPGFSTFNKRASVISMSGTPTPRTPTFFAAGHRRISSLSDPGVTPDSFDFQSSAGPVIVVDETPNEPRSSSEQSNRGLPQPRSPALPSSPPTPPLITPEELAGLRAEVGSLQRELVRTKEAKEASDICLRALRELIGVDPDSTEAPDPEAAKALKGLSLPPLPTDDADDEDDRLVPVTEVKKPSGWGIKLWGSSSVQPRKVSLSDLPAPVAQSKSEPVPAANVHSNRSSSSGGLKVDAGDKSELNQATTESLNAASSAASAKGVFRKFGLFSSSTSPPSALKVALALESHKEHADESQTDEQGQPAPLREEPHASPESTESQPAEMDAMSAESSLREPPTPQDELPVREPNLKGELHERLEPVAVGP